MQNRAAKSRGPTLDRLTAFESDELIGILQSIDAKLNDIQAQLSPVSKPLNTVEEVGEITGRSPYTVRRWVKEGRIRAIRVEGSGPRGRLLIPREELQKLLPV